MDLDGLAALVRENGAATAKVHSRLDAIEASLSALTTELRNGQGGSSGVRTNLTNVKLELRQNRHLLSAAGYAHVLDEIAVFELLLKASKDGDGRKTRSKSVFVKPGARGSRRVGASESTRNTEPDIAALTEGVVPG